MVFRASIPFGPDERTYFLVRFQICPAIVWLLIGSQVGLLGITVLLARRVRMEMQLLLPERASGQWEGQALSLVATTRGSSAYAGRLAGSTWNFCISDVHVMTCGPSNRPGSSRVPSLNQHRARGAV